MNIAKYLFLLFLVFSTSSYALPKNPFYGKISTSINGSPDDSFLGKTFKLKSDYKSIIELNVSTDKKYVMKRDDIEIIVFKDQNKLNRIRLFSKYDIFLKGRKEKNGGYFYAVCPVVEKTTKDLSEIIDVKYIDDREITRYKPISQTLSEKIIDPGFYTLANNSNKRYPILTEQPSETFVEIQVKILCIRAENVIYDYRIEESNKKSALEWIENP